MDYAMSDNPDLAWDLDFSNRLRAQEFVMQFESTLCVYSPSVQQVYTTYNMYFPKDWDRKLVILPDPSAFHDTFNFVNHEAVVATGLYIIPGELIEKEGLYLANVDENRVMSERRVPFEPGIKTIMANRAEDDPFLPVLAKGDLREFEQSWPVVHLHRIKPSLLKELSEFDRASLRSVVTEKLESLFLMQTASAISY